MKLVEAIALRGQLKSEYDIYNRLNSWIKNGNLDGDMSIREITEKLKDCSKKISKLSMIINKANWDTEVEDINI